MRGEKVMDALLDSADVIDLPLHVNSPGTATKELRVNLLDYQSQGIRSFIVTFLASLRS